MKYLAYILMFLSLFFQTDLKSQVQNQIEYAIDTKIIETIETKYEGYYAGKTSKAETMEKFDSLGRLIIRKSEYIGQSFSLEKRHFYYANSNLLNKTMEIGGHNSARNLPDTIIIRYSLNSKGKITNKVVTSTSDSLIWIQNIEYNQNNDPIFRTYQKTPEWVLDIMPSYLKDSIYYNSELNLCEDYSLGQRGGIISSAKSSIVNNRNNSIYDDFGNFLENENTKIEYSYDSHNNWISQKYFSKSKKENILNFTKTRTIHYRKE